MPHKVMSKTKNKSDDRIFIIRDEEDNIILVDDPDMCARLDAKVAEMEAKGFDEMAISSVLLRMIKNAGNGR